MPASAMRLEPRFRVFAGDEIAFGPGKAELLEAIEAKGSITGAAEKLGMSYMRAWNLVRTMNRLFRKPLVESVRGGKERGGAKVTELGSFVLSQYRAMEERAAAVVLPQWEALRESLSAENG